MDKIFFLGMTVILGGCFAAIEDSEVTVKVNSEKRKPKHQFVPPAEKPTETRFQAEKIPPIAPQVGIRIPLEK